MFQLVSDTLKKNINIVLTAIFLPSPAYHFKHSSISKCWEY